MVADFADIEACIMYAQSFDQLGMVSVSSCGQPLLTAPTLHRNLKPAMYVPIHTSVCVFVCLFFCV